MARRIKCIKWLMTFFLSIILMRLAYVQLYDGPYSGKGLAEKAARRWEMSFVTEEYARGDIVDRNGFSLTDSRVNSRIILFPWLLDQAQEALAGLKEDLFKEQNTLGTSTIDQKELTELWQAVELAKKTTSQKQGEPVILYHLNDTALLRRIEEAQVPGLAVLPVKARYGSQSIARHFVGYMLRADQLGAVGIEKKYEQWLQGETAEYQVPSIRDVSGNLLPGVLQAQPQKKLDPKRCHVITALDHKLQSFTEEIMDQHLNKGAVVVLDIESGDVLAIASRPDFDQNRISDYLNEGDALINRAIRPEFYPGSVFKVVTAAAGFEVGLIQAGESYNCNGQYTFPNGIEIGCLRSHGTVDFRSALAVSCNGYFVNLAQKIGPEALGNMSRRLGLTCSLNADANQILTGNTAIGQQGIQVSPLQIARIYAMIARDGLDIEPRQVHFIMDQQGREVISFPKAKPIRVLEESYAKEIKEALLYAAEQGTARAGRLEQQTTAGKTGTAQANASGRVLAWYCGFTPYEQPKYCIVVMVEENKSGSSQGLQGGQEAAAIFKAIGEKMLGTVLGVR